MNSEESFLVILISADGMPCAVRNTEVISVDPWQVMHSQRQKAWVYDDVVVITTPRRAKLKMGYKNSAGNYCTCWGWRAVKGPLEEVVFALNSGVHMYRQSTALP